MWLLNCTTYELELFYGEDRPHYAILSHRWEKDEVSFQQLTDGKHTGCAGWRKIKACCEQTKNDGLNYAWVDTCCIDKRSSAELSEAINSMYAWYNKASYCYAYLSDVSVAPSTLAYHRDENSNGRHGRDAPSEADAHALLPDITQSAWFTRGWTLQELLAPYELVFFDTSWTCLGTRKDHSAAIKVRTGISSSALSGYFRPEKFQIAERMSWAAGRVTTRLEDRAYSLLGIFDIHMPLLYGEGDRAFIRLQNELMKTSNDASILGWRHFKSTSNLGALATSPDCFSWRSFEGPFNSAARDISVNANGLTGSFVVSPLCFDLFVAYLGSASYITKYGTRRDNAERHEYDVFIYLRQRSENIYDRAILDGKGSTIVKRPEYSLHESRATEQPRVITIEQNICDKLSSQMIGYEHIHDPIPAVLLSTEDATRDQKCSRGRLTRAFLPGIKRDLCPEDQPLLITERHQEQRLSPCILFRCDNEHNRRENFEDMVILFTYNLISEPVALLYTLDKKYFRKLISTYDKSKETFTHTQANVYQKRALRTNIGLTNYPRSEYSTSRDDELERKAFDDIEKERVNGAKIVLLGNHGLLLNMKAVFIPQANGHRVLLAFRNSWLKCSKTFPREWLYPPPDAAG